MNPYMHKYIHTHIRTSCTYVHINEYVYAHAYIRTHYSCHTRFPDFTTCAHGDLPRSLPGSRQRTCVAVMMVIWLGKHMTMSLFLGHKIRVYIYIYMYTYFVCSPEINTYVCVCVCIWLGNYMSMHLFLGT